jgi:hypothetical protein
LEAAHDNHATEAETRSGTMTPGNAAPSDPDLSRRDWAVELLLPIAAALLSFVVVTAFVEGALLLLGVGVTGAGLPVALIVTAAWVAWLARRAHGRRWPVVWLVVVGSTTALLAVSLLYSGRVFDDTWDSQWFHQEAIHQLAEGWNPVATPLTAERVPDIGARTRIDGYAKGAWIWGASLYRLTDRIERAKAFSLPLMVAAWAVTCALLLVATRLHVIWAVVMSFLTACNPVSVVQILNVQLDGPMGSLLIIMTASGVIWLLSRARLALITATAAAATASAVKITGPFFVVLLVAGFIAAAAIRGALWDSRRELLVAALAGAAAALVLTAGSYGTNWAHFGHPLYPVRGDAPVAIVTAPLDNRFETFVVATLSRSSVQRDDETAAELIRQRRELKIPFTWTKDELHAFSTPNTRIAGWGPLSGGLLILATLILVVGAVTDFRWTTRLILVGLPIAVSVVLLPVFWKARYVPHAWMLPMIVVVLAIEAGHSRALRALGWTMLGCVALNLALIAPVHVAWACRNTVDLKERLLQLTLRREPLEVSFDKFRAGRFRLSELGIPFTEVQDPLASLPVFLGRIPLPLSGWSVTEAGGGMREVTVDWAPKDNVISYLVEVIAPPPAGPGGGALTVVRRYVERPPVTVPLPAGTSNVIVSRCNRIGCGTAAVTGPLDGGPSGPPKLVIGSPAPGEVLTEATAILTWLAPRSDDGAPSTFEVVLTDAETGEIQWERTTTDTWIRVDFSRDAAWRLSVTQVGPGQAGAVTSGFHTEGVAP